MKDSLKDIIIEIEKLSSRIEKGVIKYREYMRFLQNKISEIDEILGYDKDSDEYRMFDRFRQENGLVTIRTEITERYLNIQEMGILNKLIVLLEEIIGEEKVDNEYIFSGDSGYESKRLLINIFNSANEEILIIDPYIDKDIFDYFDGISELCKINILTKELKGQFKILYNEYSKQNKNISVKGNNNLHDRFIVIDKKIIYQLGTSINGLGSNKLFTVKKLESNYEVYYLYRENGNLL